MILIPLFFALLIGIFMAITLPKVYMAKTLILIEPQRVPQNYVQSIVSAEAGDRINTISQMILSRTNLEKIISQFDMYTGPQYSSYYLEDKLENFRERVDVRVTRDGRGADSFSISFKGKDPQKVMNITNALATSFINENLKVRESQAIGTSDFLESQLESMRQRLEQVEENMKEYRKTNMGELPEQLDSNLRILDRLQDNLNNRQSSLRDARLRLMEHREQASNRSQQVPVTGVLQGAGQDGGGSLEDLKAQLEALKVKYTDKHPDIRRLKNMITEYEAKASEELNNQQAQDLEASQMTSQDRLQALEIQRETELIEGEIEQLKRQIADYQRRVEVTPKREQELLSLNRDYENIKAAYDSLLARKLEADVAVSMERKQKGEQFRVIDPARLPEKPIEPDMKKLLIITLFLGTLIGGGSAFFLELSKPTFNNPEDIEEMCNLPVLSTIPAVYHDRQVYFRKINSVMSIVFTFVVTGLAGMLGFICITGGDSLIQALKVFI